MAIVIRIIISLIIFTFLLLLSLYRMIVITSLNEFAFTKRKEITCGSIFSRDGVPIASTLVVYDAYISNLNDRSALDKIISIVPWNKDSILERYNRGKKFIWIAKKISFEKMKELQSLAIEEVNFHQRYMRFYPYGSLFSHVIGFRDQNDIGTLGLEKSVNIRENIYTTLDLSLQSNLYSVLKKAMEEHHAEGAYGVLVSDSGEIRAMVSLPDFNPNHITIENQFNHVIHGRYELGSVMKIITFALGLKHNINLEKKYKVPMELSMGKFKIKDTSYMPELTFREAFTKSSNIVSIYVVQECGGSNEHLKFLEDAGLFDSINVDGLEVPRTKCKKWNETKSKTMAYGYGIGIAPLRFILTAFDLISGRKNSLSIIQREKKQTNKFFPEYKTLRNMLSNQNCVGEIIGYKTGTAKIVQNGYYGNKELMSCFSIIGSKNPHYLFIGLINPERRGRVFSVFFTYPMIKEFVSKSSLALWK